MMAIVANSELDLFASPPIQTSVDHSVMKDHYPVSGMIHSGPIDFNIVSSADEYLDLSDSYLHVTAHVSDSGVKGKAATDTFAPANLFIHSLFSQIDVSINGKLVSSSTNTYAYRAYIESLLSYGRAYKKSYLTNSLWYKDVAGHFDELTVDTNKGAFKRHEFLINNKKVDMMGFLHTDFFRQERLLPPGCDIKIRLVRASEQFSLMSTKPGYKTVIDNAILYVKKVKLNPAVTLAHANVLKKNNMLFPIQRVGCKVFSIPAGSLSSYREAIISGQLPTKIVIGLVKNAAYNGSHNMNPFNFEHFNLNHLSLHVDGRPDTIPSFSPDYSNNLYARSFHSLFDVTGNVNCNDDIDLERSDYPGGNCLYAFRLAHQADGVFDLMHNGSIRVDLKFSQALDTTVNVIVYAEYENVVQMDQARNLILDYAN